MKITFKSYLKWCLANFVFLILFGLTLNFLFAQHDQVKMILPSYQKLGTQQFIKILEHNLLNAVETIIGFLVFPITYLFTWTESLITIVLGISMSGLGYAIDKLLPHGIIEIPTILAYQIYSLRLLKTLIETKNMSSLLEFIRVNRNFLLLCFLGIFVGALIEGFIG